MGAKAKMKPGGTAAGNQHWCTPQWLVDLVHDVFEGPPELDPFSNRDILVDAAFAFTGPGGFDRDGFEPRDGFSEPWYEIGDTVYFNPPWKHSGRAVRHAREMLLDSTAEITGVIPCSMNSQYWPEVEASPSRCYFHKRPSFLESGVERNGNAKDCCAVYWGHRPYRFADVFSRVGRIHFGVIR